MAKITKEQQVKKHLIQKRSITSWEAINLYRATRLSAIIFKLKEKGMPIRTVRVLTPDGQFARYFLKK